MKSVYESSNVWPVVQFHAIPFANENHRARPFPQDDEMLVDIILIEYKVAQIVKATEALARDVDQLKTKWGLE